MLPFEAIQSKDIRLVSGKKKKEHEVEPPVGPDVLYMPESARLRSTTEPIVNLTEES